MIIYHSCYSTAECCLNLPKEFFLFHSKHYLEQNDTYPCEVLTFCCCCIAVTSVRNSSKAIKCWQKRETTFSEGQQCLGRFAMESFNFHTHFQHRSDSFTKWK